MNEQQYNTIRANIVVRILNHERKLYDGRYIFPRCLAADYRELNKLDKQWQTQQHHTT